MLQKTIRVVGLSAVFSLLLLNNLASWAQELPIADGAYLDPESCNMAERNELDLIRFKVMTNGRGVSFGEGSCLVASIKPLRNTRHYVDLDCQEFGDLYQHQFFLDVITPDHIRVDGEDLWLCKKGFLANEQSSSDSSTIVDDLIELWLDAHENCSGGYGNNPATHVACGKRMDLVKQLAEKGFCYGKDDQSRSEFDWHKCEKNSFR